MEYQDRIYGATNIVSPVLLDLLESHALHRLEGVLQHGITALIGITRPVSRLEHSIGVMMLVQRCGGALEEQIAALLHDVSHTAFSHVIDYVFDGHERQSYHEEHKEWFMAQSDLPHTLARHGYDWRTFLHEDDYPLLEQPAPALCADRLDYFLRDSYDLGLAALEDILHALAHLIVSDGRLAVDDLGVARWMGYTYIAADQASWANFREVGLYELAAQAIRYALDESLITEGDLWTTDAEVWAKLHAAPDPRLQARLARVSPATRFAWDETAPDFRVATKLRTIDPDILWDGNLRCLSDLDADFARYRAEYLSSKSGKWPVKVTLSSGKESIVN